MSQGPNGVATFPKPKFPIWFGRDGVASLIAPIFADGVKDESALGKEAIPERLSIHAIARDGDQELRDQPVQGGRKPAMDSPVPLKGDGGRIVG